MNKVQQVISEIHEKVAGLKASLGDVETENESLKSELEVLKGKLNKTEQEAADFREKYDVLKDQLHSSDSSDVSEDKDEQIDLLVREIDECINRLKA